MPRGARSRADHNPRERILRRLGTGLIATTLISGVAAAGAAGHTVRYDSVVTAKFDKQAKIFDGTVDSAKRGCARKRSVNVRLRAADGSSTVIGTDLTDSLGAWVVAPTSDPAPGIYFAEATKKVTRKNEKHRHVCKPAASKDLTVK